MDQERRVVMLVRVKVPDQPGVFHVLTEMISHRRATITSVSSATRRADPPATYVEVAQVDDPDGLLRDFAGLPIARDLEKAPSFGLSPGPIVRTSGASGSPSMPSRAG